MIVRNKYLETNVSILELHKRKFRARAMQLNNGEFIQKSFNSGNMKEYRRLMGICADRDYIAVKSVDDLIKSVGGDIYFYARLSRDEKGDLYLPQSQIDQIIKKSS
jgi:hypothetical protein